MGIPGNFLKKNILLLLVLIPGICMMPAAVAQKYNFTNYNTTSGLPSNEIRGIFQNAKGALFVTTTAGISIFDGYRFKNFDYRDGIRYDFVKNFAEIDDETMYLFGNTGKEAYIFKNNTYKGFFKTPNVVTQYFRDKQNNGFVCTDNGIFQLIDTSFIKVQITNDTSRFTVAFYKYVQANDSTAIVLRTYPVNRLDIINTKQKKIIYTIPGLFGYHFLRDSRNRIWLCTDYLGAKMIDEETLQTPSGLFKHTPPELDKLAGIQVNYAVEDKKGNVWLATTGKGLVKIAPDGSCKFLTKENGLLSNTIFKIFADRDDNLWIGTESGLQRMLEKQMVLYDMNAGLPDDAVYDAVSVDSVTLLLSTKYDISVLNLKTGNIRNYKLPHPEEGYVVRFLKNKKDIWALTPKRILKIEINKLQPVEELTPASAQEMKDFLQLDDGSFLTISTSRIVRYERNRQTIIADSLPSGRTLIRDNDDHIWAATNKGLFIYAAEEGQNGPSFKPLIKNYLFDLVFQTRSFSKDDKGNIWAATGEKGLYQLSFRENKLTILQKIRREDGLSNDKAKDLLMMNDSTLICGTISGIDRIILKGEGRKLSRIEKLSSLPDNSYSLKMSYDENFLMVPFVGGLLLYPDPAKSSHKSSGTNAFTGFYVNGKEYQGSFENKNLDLAHDQNNLLFYFSPYVYSNNNYKFSYWLDNGEKENWSEPGPQNYVQFNNLPPGSYTLHIRMMQNDEPGNFSLISRPFSIRPLWYQTIVSKIVALLLLVAVIIYFTRRRIISIRKNALIRQKIIETEMAALKAQMNPHFMFNCINSIDAFIHDNDKYNATLYLNKFAKLLRNILDSSRNSTVAFSKDIETLRLYIELEELRHENKFSTKISIDNDLMEANYKVPPLIIQPFVENAILHGLKNRPGNTGLLEIQVSRKANNIQYTITDNGIGRKAAAAISQHKESSYGMQMSFERIKLFNREDEAAVEVEDLVENNTATGTRITIKLKIS